MQNATEIPIGVDPTRDAPRAFYTQSSVEYALGGGQENFQESFAGILQRNLDSSTATPYNASNPYTHNPPETNVEYSDTRYQESTTPHKTAHTSDVAHEPSPEPRDHSSGDTSGAAAAESSSDYDTEERPPDTPSQSTPAESASAAAYATESKARTVRTTKVRNAHAESANSVNQVAPQKRFGSGLTVGKGQLETALLSRVSSAVSKEGTRGTTINVSAVKYGGETDDGTHNQSTIKKNAKGRSEPSSNRTVLSRKFESSATQSQRSDFLESHALNKVGDTHLVGTRSIGIDIIDRSLLIEGLRVEHHSQGESDTSLKSFSQELHQFLKTTGKDNILQHARFVIRSGQEGDIRLLLKPEELGSVRVNLHLNNQFLNGRIVVDNPVARTLIEHNLPDLLRAFRENGIDIGSLDVTLDQNPTPSSFTQSHRSDKSAHYGVAATSIVEEHTFLTEIGESALINLYA